MNCTFLSGEDISIAVFGVILKKPFPGFTETGWGIMVIGFGFWEKVVKDKIMHPRRNTNRVIFHQILNTANLRGKKELAIVSETTKVHIWESEMGWILIL